MDRHEVEELYTEVDRPIPTDVGRMAYNVARVRLIIVALVVACALLACLALSAGLVVGGLLDIAAGPLPPRATPLP